MSTGISQYQQPPFMPEIGDWQSGIPQQEQEGSEYLSDSPQSLAMQPPPGKGGKKGGPGNWWMAAAAPIIAALGSKLSGGKLSFQDALGNLGQGFASAKLGQMQQKRQREFEQEGQTIEMAHKAVQGLGKLSPQSMQKYPRLQELSQKYSEALADDGKVSAKEASEIMVLYQLAQNDMEQAGTEEGQALESTTLRRRTMEGAQNTEDAQRAGIERQVMRGNWGPLGNEGIESAVDEGWDQQYGTIPVQVNGQTVQMSRKEAAPYIKMEQQAQRAKETLEIVKKRLGVAQAGLGLASKRFDWAQQNATLNRASMLARSFVGSPDFEGASPEEIAEAVIQATQAGLNDPQKLQPRPPVTSGGTPPPGGKKFSNVTVR